MTEAKGLHSTLVVNCVLNSFLSSTAILLNIITIQALRKTPSLSKPLKTLLLSLAVSDLGVGFLVQPTYVAVLVMKIKQNAENRTYDTIFHAFFIQNFLFVFAYINAIKCFKTWCTKTCDAICWGLFFSCYRPWNFKDYLKNCLLKFMKPRKSWKMSVEFRRVSEWKWISIW